MTVNKTVLVAAVAILVVGSAIAIPLVFFKQENVEKTYTFEDTLGNEISLDIPLSGVCITNPYLAVNMRLYGLSEYVKGASWDSPMFMFDPLVKAIYEGVPNIGSDMAPNPTSILQTECNVVISTAGARDVGNVDVLKDHGITTIFLSGTGMTAMDDMDIIKKLFGAENKQSVKDFENFYRNSVMDTKEKIAALGLDEFTFLIPHAWGGTTPRYSGVGAHGGLAMKMLTPKAKNLLSTLAPDDKSSSVFVSSDLIAANLDSVDYVFILGVAPGTPNGRAFPDNFIGWVPSAPMSQPYVNENAYWFDYNLFFTLFDFVGYMAMAEMLGATFEKTALEAANGVLETYIPEATQFTNIFGKHTPAETV
ncbi:MAG: ABC transporter substrate-binding protein [Thermoplasmatales archaeon]|nr:ABC transporter substrate-binding protein [Thermoplasmatales archaeon]